MTEVLKDVQGMRFLTGVQLMEMPRWQRYLVEQQPNVWRPYPNPALDVLVNLAHPDNTELAARDLLNEAMRLLEKKP